MKWNVIGNLLIIFTGVFFIIWAINETKSEEPKIIHMNSYYVIYGLKKGAYAESEWRQPIDIPVFEADTAKQIMEKITVEIEKEMHLNRETELYTIRIIGIFLLKVSRYN